MTDHGILHCTAVPSRPEKRLMLAVLDGAVSDFQKYATAASGRGRRLFAEADAWLQATDADRPFDFENVCHALDLDPAFMRDGLRRWRAARQSHHAAPATRIQVAPTDRRLAAPGRSDRPRGGRVRALARAVGDRP